MAETFKAKMKNRNNRYSSNFPQQTHFIGILLPEDITLTLEDCRRYMREAYGCKSGHATPIHVTLIPPFRLLDDIQQQTLHVQLKKRYYLKAKVSNICITENDVFKMKNMLVKL